MNGGDWTAEESRLMVEKGYVDRVISGCLGLRHMRLEATEHTRI